MSVKIKFKKFLKRSSFSTNNEWPEDSPSAGFYDVKNSDTKLILLNNQKTWVNLNKIHKVFNK